VHNGSGALILTANSSFSGKATNLGGILQLGDGTSGNGSLVGDINVGATNTLRYFYTGGDVTLGNTVSGSGTINYDLAAGNRTYTIPLSVTNANFTGTNNIAAGVRLHASDGNGGFILGNGNVVNVASAGQAWLDRSATNYNQSFTIAGNGWTGDAMPLGALRVFNCTLTGPVNLVADSRIGGSINGAAIVGQVTGNYQLEVLGNPGSFILQLGPTNGLNNNYGATLITSGSIQASSSGAISTNALTVMGQGELRLNGHNLSVASLSGTAVGGTNASIINYDTVSNATLTVGADGTSTAPEVVFGDGRSRSLGLTKVGPGTLTLSGDSTNTGAITVNGGTLALTGGSIGSGSFSNAAQFEVSSGAVLDVSGRNDATLTLNSGQTLGGNGSVNGSLVASVGSTITPGSSVGTLTVSTNITLGGNLLMELNRSLSPNSDRLISAAGTITGGGTLTVTNIGPALQANDTFQLFLTGVSGITANLPTTDAANGRAYTWQNNISGSGSIMVLTSTPIARPVLTNSFSGTTLTLSWSGAFKLQAQTNGVNVGVSTNWGDYPGGGTSPVHVTINPANPTVFFRLSQ
jgi:autotransporter-associated beta strand protein